MQISLIEKHLKLLTNTNNYYNVENAIERIRELYELFKDWTSMNVFYPVNGTQKFKNEYKIAV